MQIKYEITPEDLVQYYKETAKANPVHKVYLIVVVTLTILFMLGDALVALYAMGLNDGSIQVESVNMLPRLIIALTIAALLSGALMIYSKLAMSKVLATPGKNGVFCEHTLTLDATGFTEETEVNRGYQSWQGVEKVFETSAAVIIQIRLGAGYLIPKRSFQDDGEMRSFIDLANGYLRKANAEA